MQFKLRVASDLNLPLYESMEWNMEENFSMEWNMEWKIFSMEWKKISSMEYGKIVFHSIPYHALVLRDITSYNPTSYDIDIYGNLFYMV